MWEYSEKVRDHYLNPRNVGEIENPDGFGETGNIKCGDALRLTFKLDDTKRIADIKFKTFGCGSAIASSSVLTEMCKGLTVEEAALITNDDIAQALEGLPNAKMHCSVMGQEALELAIAYYKNGGKKAEVVEQSRLVCACFSVYEDDIVAKIRQNGLTSVAQVTNYTKAGGGCGSCIQDIQEILDRVLQEMDDEHGHNHDNAPAQVEAPKALTSLEKIDLIRKVLNEDIRPGLMRDGGDCELLDVDGNVVKIRFIGACRGCAFSATTSNEFIAKTLQEKVSASLIVEVQ